MNGPCVDIYGEDRTGGGLQDFLWQAAAATRRELEKPDLRHPRGDWGFATNNSALLKQCDRYGTVRFDRRPQLDHVFFIIDLKEVHSIVGEDPVRPAHQHEDIRRVEAATLREMQKRARGRTSDAEWDKTKAGFHPFVLVWERESLMLPVLEELGMGPSHATPYERETAARLVADRFPRRRPGRVYDKGTDGRELLREIAGSPELRLKVLDSNESVRRIVKALTEL